MLVRHVGYENGAIRNAAGVLVAFYEAETKQLSINGLVPTLYAETMETAMEIVGERVS